MTEVAQERGKSSLPDEPATSGNEAKQVARAFVQFGRLGKFTRLARSSVRDASGMPQRANGTPKEKEQGGAAPEAPTRPKAAQIVETSVLQQIHGGCRQLFDRLKAALIPRRCTA